MGILFNHIFIICLISSLSFTVMDWQNDKEWKLEKDKNGIKVYTQKQSDNLKAFKAITKTNKSMLELENLVEKVENYPQWMSDVATCRQIKLVHADEAYVYSTSDAPWPIKDRDIVTKANCIKSKDGSLRYEFQTYPGKVEELEDYIRIKKAKGSWHFIPLDDGQIEITYQFYADPGGSIPTWLVNLFIVKGPYETLLNMR